jgi:hypothetical protein
VSGIKLIKFEKALIDEGMWAVVVAEGLDIFWALRKGEGCLGRWPVNSVVIAAARRQGKGRYRRYL